MANPIRNNKGQGLIETIWMLSFAVLLFTGLVTLAYRSAVSQYATYGLEEALICAASSRQEKACEKVLYQGLSHWTLFQEKVSVRLLKSKYDVQGQVDILFSPLIPYFQKFELQRRLLLPLERNK